VRASTRFARHPRFQGRHKNPLKYPLTRTNEGIHKVPVCVSLSSTRVKTVVKPWCECCQKVSQIVRCVCETVYYLCKNCSHIYLQF
jgi:hypothetical protein